MSKLAKTGGALLGLAALGTFVAALGGPNVFSTFSNVLSTISPKTEISVEGKKEEKQNEDNKAPTESKQEEKKDWIIENKEEVKEENLTPPTPPVAQLLPTVTPEIKTEPKVQPQVISQETRSLSTNSTRSSSLARRGIQEPSGRYRYRPPSQNKGGNSEGSGIWCGTSSGSVMMKEGDTCLGVPFETIKKTLIGK